jgi:phage baseplate assembly protein W
MQSVNYPFQLDSFGRIVSTADTNKIYTDRLLTLLSTPTNSRPMMPNYGTDIARSLYETGGQAATAIKESIRRAVALYLPELEIKALRISDTYSDGTLNVELSVGFPDNSVNFLSIKTSNFLPDGTTLGYII